MREMLVPLVLAAGVDLAVGVAGAAAQTARIPDDDKRIRIPMEEVFSVGRAEGATWETLSDVQQVAFDDAGRLYVLDRGNARVLVFGPSGRFVRQIGERGPGPGELQRPSQLAVLDDGSIVVGDAARRSFSIFSAEGEYRSSIPYPHRYGLVTGGMAAHPAGGVVFATLPVPGMSTASRPALVRQPLSGDVERLYEAAPDEPLADGAASSGSQVTMIQRPAFAPRLRWTMLEDGSLVAVDGTGFDLTVVGPSGAVRRRLRRAIEPRAVTEEDREWERDRRAADFEGGNSVVVGGGDLPPAVRQLVAQRLRNVSFAPVMPVVERLRADAGGRLWIERSGPVAGTPGPVDVVTLEGGYVGTLTSQRLPSAFGPNGLVAYVSTDDLGVERVEVLRLPEGWRR